jgi:hypothetical protein
MKFNTVRHTQAWIIESVSMKVEQMKMLYITDNAILEWDVIENFISPKTRKWQTCGLDFIRYSPTYIDCKAGSKLEQNELSSYSLFCICVACIGYCKVVTPWSL